MDNEGRQRGAVQVPSGDLIWAELEREIGAPVPVGKPANSFTADEIARRMGVSPVRACHVMNDLCTAGRWKKLQFRNPNTGRRMVSYQKVKGK